MAKFYRLQWKIRAHKLYYYFPDKVHSDWQAKLQITDQEYDGLEQEYKTLAKDLGLDTRATDMVGFTFDKETRWVSTLYSQPKQ